MQTNFRYAIARMRSCPDVEETNICLDAGCSLSLGDEERITQQLAHLDPHARHWPWIRIQPAPVIRRLRCTHVLPYSRRQFGQGLTRAASSPEIVGRCPYRWLTSWSL